MHFRSIATRDTRACSSSYWPMPGKSKENGTYKIFSILFLLSDSGFGFRFWIPNVKLILWKNKIGPIGDACACPSSYQHFACEAIARNASRTVQFQNVWTVRFWHSKALINHYYNLTTILLYLIDWLVLCDKCWWGLQTNYTMSVLPKIVLMFW